MANHYNIYQLLSLNINYLRLEPSEIQPRVVSLE
jgi:hypothetical protein